MESFANAGRGIRDMVPHLLASQPNGWRGQAVAAYARWRYGGHDIDAVIAAADTQLQLDLDHVDVTQALAATRSCVLLLHGDADQHIPVAHGRALALASPRAHYLELHDEDHLSLPLRLDLLAQPIDAWLAQTQQDRGTCPAPQALPASTLAVAAAAATPPRS